MDMIESPKGEKKILRNKAVTNRKKGGEKLRPHEITQIQPQKLTLTLRSGEEPFRQYLLWLLLSAITRH